MRFDLDGAIAFYEKNEPKGEFVLVLEGLDRNEEKEKEKKNWQEVSLEDHMKIYLDAGMDKKEAMKAVAKDRGISKSDVYKALL